MLIQQQGVSGTPPFCKSLLLVTFDPTKLPGLKTLSVQAKLQEVLRPLTALTARRCSGHQEAGPPLAPTQRTLPSLPPPPPHSAPPRPHPTPHHPRGAHGVLVGRRTSSQRRAGGKLGPHGWAERLPRHKQERGKRHSPAWVAEEESLRVPGGPACTSFLLCSKWTLRSHRTKRREASPPMRAGYCLRATRAVGASRHSLGRWRLPQKCQGLVCAVGGKGKKTSGKRGTPGPP